MKKCITLSKRFISEEEGAAMVVYVLSALVAISFVSFLTLMALIRNASRMERDYEAYLKARQEKVARRRSA